MDRRQKLVDVFEDTQRFYRENPLLSKAIQAAKAATKLYEADDYPDIPCAPDADGTVLVTKYKTFEAAISIHADPPEWKIAVLNFASATNPGGGVSPGRELMQMLNTVSNANAGVALGSVLSEKPGRT